MYFKRVIIAIIFMGSSILNSSAPTNMLPIVYSPDYNIYFYGLEKFSPFDTTKYGKVADALKQKFGKEFYTPEGPISDTALATVHDQAYLDSLKSRFVVARIAEDATLALFPNSIQQQKLLYPIKLATRGTIDAALLAYKNKQWAINLSGGYHHAEKETGDGFCFFADIPLAINELWKQEPNLRIFYIDTDAHQGNGVETIFKDKLLQAKNNPEKSQLIIFDIYSDEDYPKTPISQSKYDKILVALFKKMGFYDPTEDIRKRVDEVRPLIQYGYKLEVTKIRPTEDVKYLTEIGRMIKDLTKETTKAKEQNVPLFIFYNAGTDPFNADPVAWLGVSKEGLILRDYLIWEFAHDNQIPIVMTLSGGYSYQSAGIIAESITKILRDIWKIPLTPQPENKEQNKPQQKTWMEYFFGAWHKKVVS